MKIPQGHTEATVLAAIEKAVNILAPSFTFGYFDVDDMKQQGRLYALQLLEKDKYDPKLPLENFVYTHIRNRYCNLKRDLLRRTDPPCRKCHSGYPCEDGRECKPYRAWKKRNTAKANLIRPLDLQNVSDENESRTRTESTVVEEAEQAEILRLIDEKLPVELRAAFLQIKAGVSLPKARREQVKAAVREILGDAV